MSVDRDRQMAEELKAEMMKTIQKFFDTRLSPTSDSPSRRTSDRRCQLATAVLLIEMTRADHKIKLEERQAVVDACGRVLDLTGEEIEEMVRLAEEQVRQSAPLYQFARLIDQEFSLEQKKLVIELMWRVAFADAEILAHEEYLVRKVSGQLHVPRTDFLDAKIKARDDFR